MSGTRSRGSTFILKYNHRRLDAAPQHHSSSNADTSFRPEAPFSVGVVSTRRLNEAFE